MTVESIPIDEEPQESTPEPPASEPPASDPPASEPAASEPPESSEPPKRGRGRPPGAKNKPRVVAEPVRDPTPEPVRDPTPEPPKKRVRVVKPKAEPVPKASRPSVQPQVSDTPPAQDLFRLHMQEIKERARLEHDARRSHYTRLLEENLGVM